MPSPSGNLPSIALALAASRRSSAIWEALRFFLGARGHVSPAAGEPAWAGATERADVAAREVGTCFAAEDGRAQGGAPALRWNLVLRGRLAGTAAAAGRLAEAALVERRLYWWEGPVLGGTVAVESAGAAAEAAGEGTGGVAAE
jgi:hypothetical protein